jgi:vancomycin resistance protein VanJ
MATRFPPNNRSPRYSHRPPKNWYTTQARESPNPLRSLPELMSSPPAPAARVLFGRTRSVLSTGAWGLAALGIGLHLTIRDAFSGLSPVFYALPRPVILGLLVMAVLVWPPQHAAAHWLRQGIVGVVLAWAVWGTVVLQAVPAPASSLRIGFWNCCRGLRGWDNVTAEVANWDADVVGLVEAGDSGPERAAFWRERLPGYDVRTGRDGMVFAVRGTIQGYRREILSVHGTAGVFDAEIDGRRLACVLVDLNSHPGYSRKATVAQLKRVLQGLADRAVIVMGDFNTPDDSVWFQTLKPEFRPAFRSHGRGYAPTWPVPLPVLTLDQMWLNGHVQGFTARHGWSTLSDHRPVFCSVRLR